MDFSQPLWEEFGKNPPSERQKPLGAITAAEGLFSWAGGRRTPARPVSGHCREGSLETAVAPGRPRSGVHCRVGSSENPLPAVFDLGLVHCRAGSLETAADFGPDSTLVHCRAGSQARPAGFFAPGSGVFETRTPSAKAWWKSPSPAGDLGSRDGVGQADTPGAHLLAAQRPGRARPDFRRASLAGPLKGQPPASPTGAHPEALARGPASSA